MMLRKIAALSATAVLALTLAGCSQSQEPKEQSEPSSTQAAQTERQPLEIESSGYYFDKSGYAHYAVVVNNPNMGKAASSAKVNITGKDKDGKIVGSDTEYITALYANGKTAIAWQTSFTGAKTLEFQVPDASDMWVDNDTQMADYDSKLHADNVNESNQGYGSYKVSGEVTNSSEYEFGGSPVVAVLKDSDGNVLGGDTTYVDLSPNSTTPFSIDFLDMPKHASVDIYVGVGNPKNV